MSYTPLKAQGYYLINLNDKGEYKGLEKTNWVKNGVK